MRRIADVEDDKGALRVLAFQQGKTGSAKEDASADDHLASSEDIRDHRGMHISPLLEPQPQDST